MKVTVPDEVCAELQTVEVVGLVLVLELLLLQLLPVLA